MTTEVDVAIVGAGLVGMASAIALQQAGFSVALIDSKSPDQSTDADDNVWDQRIYAISPKNAAWLDCLGIWQLLKPTRIGEMQAMQIWGDASEAPLDLAAEDVNQDHLGFIVEAGNLTQALMQKIEASDIHIMFNNRCAALTTQPNKAVLELTNQAMIQSTLLLAADGSHSWVREQLSMPMQQKSYDQIAIVANFEVKSAHSNIARQWFAHDVDGKNSILAWLPLPGNRISIVWSVSSQYASQLLQLTIDEFTKEVAKAGNHQLGEMGLITSPASFPLALQTSTTLTKDCVVLVGDAAHQIHPMAGQGMNLGFRDVINLVELLKDKSSYQSVSDSGLLKRYSRVRKADTLNMLMLTDGLYRLFASRNGTVKKVRNWGLSVTKHKSIKKLLVENAIAL
ncbi:MAG TPA: FAD-dependent oxidoreductase [Methylotenera sp.]|nr:FAD-dependent oxidoreductase [Methylotenera sp.]